MLTALDVPYVDTRAAALSYALGLPDLPALATLDLPTGAGTGTGAALTLRLLGASHQIVLTTPAGRFSETVACLSDAPSGLPASAERQLPDGTYRFRSEVLRLRSDEFARQVATVRELAGHGWALVGQFPGEPDALTALAAPPGPDGPLWATWHAYPSTGELVKTETWLVVC